MDMEKLCPGCMHRLDAQERDSTEKIQNQSGMGQNAQNRTSMRKKEPCCPYCGFDPSAYQQNPRCLPLNTILAGKYLVGKVLGEGGFGITYMGYDLNMKICVAIKEYFPVELVSRDTTYRTEGSDRIISLSGEKSKTYQQGLKKYVDEARNVSQFSGTPGVVSVKDFFYENDTAYIVMEYIEGVSLKEYLKQKGGKFSEEEALAILRPVLEALEKVHEAGIVHRDISPDNIMLTFAGESGKGFDAGGNGSAASSADGNRNAAASESNTAAGSVCENIAAVRLIDFGAARMTAKNDQKSLTIILKHGYAPEEQYRSHGEQGPWTDVYALCAVFYRILTGKVPEPAMDRLFSDSLKRPEELGAAVSPAVSEAIMRGLAVKKDDRIQTVRELSDILYSGKKLKKAEQEKQRRIFRIAALAAGIVVVVAAVFGIKAVLEVDRVKKADSSVQETAALPKNIAQETGIVEDAAKEEEAEQLFKEEELTLWKEEPGEQIVFSSPQTAVSSARLAHTLFCLPDGTVKALGRNQYGQCDVGNWQDVVAVAVSNNHSLGLRSDGKVYASGSNGYGQCETGSWHDIVAVAAGSGVSFGLRSDGILEACGNVDPYIDEIASWSGIHAIEVRRGGGLIGLDETGTIHYAGFEQEMPEITDWEDVRWLCLEKRQKNCLMGICEDGTVRYRLLEDSLESGEDYDSVENWADIQQLNADTELMLGVKKDGTVAFSDNIDPEIQQELSTWSGLKAICSAYSSSGGGCLIFGLKQDGSILEYDKNLGNADLSEMKNLKWIQVIDSIGDNLIAVTKDGRVLTNGFYVNLSYLEYELVSLGISPTELKEIAGTDAFLTENGELYFNGSIFGEKNPENNIRQVTKLWGDLYSSENMEEVFTQAYALLLNDGRVRFYQLGDSLEGTGVYMEEYLPEIKQVESWTDVVQILGTEIEIWGLHADGTVSVTNADAAARMDDVCGVRRLAGFTNSAVSRLTDVMALMEDGTVQPLISNEYSVQFGRTQVTGWSNVVDIAVGESHVAGLLSDGTVVAAGSNHEGQCDVEDWENIVFLTAGKNCTLGITEDGELKMAGSLY